MNSLINRYKNKVMKRYLNEDLPFKVRVLNVALLSAFGMGVIETIISALYGAPLVNIIITFVLTLMMHFILLGMERTQEYELYAILAVGLCNFVMMPLIYISGGGKEGAMSLYFTLGIVFTFLLLEKRLLIVTVIIELLNYEAVIAFSYFYPQYIVPFQNKSTSFIELGQSIIVVSLSISIAVSLQLHLYESEKQKNERQNEELLKAIETKEIAMAEAKEAKEAAEYANKAKSMFLASMSHEIRTPMNVIIGMTEIILKSNINESVERNAYDIKNSAKMLLTIINDILDFSKIESGKTEIIEDKYRLDVVLAEIANMFLIKLEDRPINMEFNINPDIPNNLIGDQTRLKEIVINLIGNAVKFTKIGTIMINVDCDIFNDDVILKISVSDTGIGIREKDIPNLFNSFERVNSEENMYVKGTGLGLAISKKLIEIMGGKIYVESIYGKGSTFSFTLPQKKEILSRRIQVSNLQTLLKNSIRYENMKEENQDSFICLNTKVLVVDDNDVNLRVAEGILRFYGIKVDKAKSGRHALEMVKNNKYNIIFIDYMMSELNGIETLKLIRNIESDYCKDVPIVALTANAVNWAEEMFIKSGFNDYISKPIEINKIEQVIKKYISEDLIVAKTEISDENLIIDNFIDIDVIDVKKGLLLCNNEIDKYIEILKVISVDSLRKIKALKDSLKKKRFDDYIIEVHGLKSVAASIGAFKLAELAKEHEIHGKIKAFDYICENFKLLIEEYEHVVTAITNGLKKKSIDLNSDIEFSGYKINIMEGELRQKIENSIQLIENFDYDKSIKEVKELFRYNLSNEIIEILVKVKDAIKALEYDEGANLLREILN